MRQILLLSLTIFLSSVSATAQQYPMGTPNVETCGGIFVDSGGNGPYGPGENLTTTICPDGSDPINGTHVRLNFTGMDLGPGDNLTFYDGDDATAVELANVVANFIDQPEFVINASATNPTGCVTMVFTSNNNVEGEGWAASIECTPNCQTIISSIITSDPPVFPADTGYIDVCPGDRIFFEGAGIYPEDGEVYSHSDFTSDFMWDFGDGTFGLGPNVSHIYEEPGGYIVQLTITDQKGCRNTNLISQRVRVSPFPDFNLGGSIVEEICVGDTVALNAVVDQLDTAYNVSVDGNIGVFSVGGIVSDSLPLPDGTGASYDTPISFGVFSPGAVLTDINDLLSICTNIEHSWMRDIEIKITCPSGQEVILVNQITSGGEVYLGIPNDPDPGGGIVPGVGYDYCWTPEATNPDWLAYANTFFPQTLPPDDYSSFQDLEGLLGCPLNGDWVLTITDNWGTDNGFIFNWSITFADYLYPDAETFRPGFVDWNWTDAPSIIFQTQDSVIAVPQNAGAALYTFNIENDFGCTFDTTIVVDVLPETHPNCYSCQDNIVNAPDTVICPGESVALSMVNPNSGIGQEVPVTFEAFPLYEISFLNHPNPNPYEATMNVSSINPPTINDPLNDIVSVCVTMETQWLGDIQMRLRSPQGAIMELSTDNGIGVGDYDNVCFSPTATIPIAGAAPPFTGDYVPEGDWNDLMGSTTNGTWTLLVSDGAGFTDVGRLVGWSITFNTSNEINYGWSPTDGLSCVNCPDPVVTPGSSTEYILNTLDSYQCADSDTFMITVLDPGVGPTVTWTAVNSTEILFEWNQIGPVGSLYEVNIDGSGWITANQPLGHLYTNATIGIPVSIEVRLADDSVVPCPVGNGTTTALLGPSNCQLSVEIASVQPSTCFCSCNGSIQLSTFLAAAPITYFFYDANTDVLLNTIQSNSGIFNGICGGDYYVVVEDALMCSDTTDNFTVDEPEAIVFDVEETMAVSCAGGNDGVASVQNLMGGSGNFSYLWSDPNGQTGDVATGLEAGLYYVTITDQICSNCPIVDSVLITEPPPLQLMLTQDNVLCFGESTGSVTAIPSGGTEAGDYEFNWSAPGATATITDLPAGPVTVTVTDDLGCITTATAIVEQPAEPVSLTIDQTQISCDSEAQSEALVMPAGGTGAYTYLWSNGATSPSVSMLDTLTYSVTVTDANGCPAVSFIDIEDYPPITAFINTSDPDCTGGATGGIAANLVEGGSGSGYTYQWNTPNNDMVAGVLNIPGGTYTVTITDGAGCQNTFSATLQEAPEVVFEFAVNEPNCFDSEDGSAEVINVQNANDTLFYDWGPNANNQTTAQATGLAAGTYTVTVTDEEGCVAENEVTIGAPEALEADFTTTDNECFSDFDGTITTEVTGGAGGYEFFWNTNATAADLNDLPGGTYFVTIVDDNGCQLFDSVEVVSPEALELEITPTDPICSGDENGMIDIEVGGGTPPFRFSLDNETYVGSNRLIGLESGEYLVYVEDGNGCLQIDTATLSEPDDISVDIHYEGEPTRDILIDLGDVADLLGVPTGGNGAISYFWSSPDTSYVELAADLIQASPQETVPYYLTVVDESGCEAENYVLIRVQKTRRVLVPTGFSPNGDGQNDVLIVHGQSGTKVKIFRIFDRWGELVYEVGDFNVNNATEGWDGIFRGQRAPIDTYIWYLEVEYEDKMTEQFRGETTLVR